MTRNMMCPICNNDTFEEGEYVDVGVGMVQCSPGGCFYCGYVEKSGYEYDQDTPTFDQFSKLWELQVSVYDLP